MQSQMPVKDSPYLMPEYAVGDNMQDFDNAFPSHMGSSDHYQNGLSSSYPPTAHCYPSSLPTPASPEPPPSSSKRRSRRVTMSSDSSNSDRFKSAQASTRKRRTSVTSNTAIRPSSLSVIPESGLRGLGTSPSSPRGRRLGPLSDPVATAAAQKRSNRDVCIRCRKDKAVVSAVALFRDPHTDRKGKLPCEKCSENKPSKWVRPCVKANFLDLVLLGPLNWLCKSSLYEKNDDTNAIQVQSALSHLTLDQCQRVTGIQPRYNDESTPNIRAPRTGNPPPSCLRIIIHD